MCSDDGDGRREEGMRGRGFRFAGQIETLGKVESSASIEATVVVVAKHDEEMIVPERRIPLIFYIVIVPFT